MGVFSSAGMSMTVSPEEGPPCEEVEGGPFAPEVLGPSTDRENIRFISGLHNIDSCTKLGTLSNLYYTDIQFDEHKSHRN